MVLGFALILLALLAIYSALRGKTIAETIRGDLGTGEFIKLDLPSFDIIPASHIGSSGGASSGLSTASATGSASGGAKGIVDQGAQIAAGFGCKVVSDSRPGATTSSGNTSDHSENNANRAARDISNARDAIKGPPTPEMDAAVEAIASAFGKRVNGKRSIVLTWHWNGYRLQLIYRTPAYGGHMGHIHFGARKD